MHGSSCLVFSERRPPARLRLFCLAHAGGSAAFYRTWSSRLPARVEVCALELPGRGRRWSEALPRDLQQLVVELQRDMAPELDRPYAIFGHSVGALIAFELARCLRRSGQPLPVALFASGRQAPQLKARVPRVSELPEGAFIDAMKRYGSSSSEVLDHPELRELFVPILRADIALNERYEYYSEEPLAFPLHILWGSSDETVQNADAAAWSKMTSGPSCASSFAGDHFFPRSAESEVVAFVSSVLQGSPGWEP